MIFFDGQSDQTEHAGSLQDKAEEKYIKACQGDCPCEDPPQMACIIDGKGVPLWASFKYVL